MFRWKKSPNCQKCGRRWQPGLGGAAAAWPWWPLEGMRSPQRTGDLVIFLSLEPGISYDDETTILGVTYDFIGISQNRNLRLKWLYLLCSGNFVGVLVFVR